MEQSLVTSSCKIVVDAMGGDYAPLNEVSGAVQALIDFPAIDLYLIGRKNEIEKILESEKLNFNSEKIIHAEEVITMSDTPTIAIKQKQNSSIVIGTQLVKEKKADAFVSAGNTGAVVTAATLIMGRIKNVERPTIGTYYPNSAGVCTVFDVGAFVDCKPQHLLNYGILSSLYVKEIYGIPNPSIGILSTGEEEEKGNKLTKEATLLFKNSKLNFIGNLEGKDILNGKANIVICDGFIGNIILKFGESVPKLLKHLLKEYAKKSLLNKLKMGLLKNSLKEALIPLDPNLYGGVPLLGVNGICIIGHGSSSAVGIKNMIIRAKEMHEKNIVNKIEESLKEYSKIG
ncbi:MAG: phosphate acyltransferase PlsX [Ignavibacteriales bacterium]|nr:phosphate acyltransferase PlsX [Ignavibacteriales bacterium]